MEQARPLFGLALDFYGCDEPAFKKDSEGRPASSAHPRLGKEGKSFACFRDVANGAELEQCRSHDDGKN